MSEILDAAGVPYCKGGVMARNRAWRKSVADWRATIDGWVRRQRPADLLNVDIFFDAVPVHGDLRWARRSGTTPTIAGTRARDFQNLLIEVARQRGRPFTLLGGFRVGREGPHRSQDARPDADLHLRRACSPSGTTCGRDPRPTACRPSRPRASERRRPSHSILDAHRLILRRGDCPAARRYGSGRHPLGPGRPGPPGQGQKAALKQALAAVDEAIGLVSEGRL